MACTPPPAAPDSFDELTSYLVTHFDDEDPEALQAGMSNMRRWLNQNAVEVSEGYRLTELTPEAIDSIPDPCAVEAQVGAGAAFEVPYPLEEVVEVVLAHDPMEVYADTYVYNDRVFVEDLDCFLDQTCDRTEYHSHIENELALGISIELWMIAQIRRVDLEDGFALLYRSWWSQPGSASLDWIDVQQQYGLSATFATETGVHKLEAGWIDMALGDLEVPEDFALNLVVDSIIDSGAKLEAYLDAQQ